MPYLPSTPFNLVSQTLLGIETSEGRSPGKALSGDNYSQTLLGIETASYAGGEYQERGDNYSQTLLGIETDAGVEAAYNFAATITHKPF